MPAGLTSLRPQTTITFGSSFRISAIVRGTSTTASTTGRVVTCRRRLDLYRPTQTRLQQTGIDTGPAKMGLLSTGKTQHGLSQSRAEWTASDRGWPTRTVTRRFRWSGDRLTSTSRGTMTAQPRTGVYFPFFCFKENFKYLHRPFGHTKMFEFKSKSWKNILVWWNKTTLSLLT